jgi:putative chitinase
MDRPYFTQADFTALFPRCPDPSAFALAIEDACALREINTPRRIADFLGQLGHETGQFRVLIENLNYGEKGLLATGGKYFTPAQAKTYAHQPEWIANRAYANRMGNGNEASGDGWKYRGRGMIQLTGHDNYLAYQEAEPACQCVEQPDLILYPRWAARSAAWYWQRHGLNELSDDGDFEELTKRINRAKLGLAERQELADRAMETMFS